MYFVCVVIWLSVLVASCLLCRQRLITLSQNLATGADFGVILNTTPQMMNSLRLVWIISSHYNKDERMVPLMERIAWELSERVKRVVNVRVLFKYVSYPPSPSRRCPI